MQKQNPPTKSTHVQKLVAAPKFSKNAKVRRTPHSVIVAALALHKAIADGTQKPVTLGVLDEQAESDNKTP